MCNAFLEVIEYLIAFYPGPGTWHMPMRLVNPTNPAYLFLSAQQTRLDAIRGLILAALASAGGYVPTPIDKL